MITLDVAVWIVRIVWAICFAIPILGLVALFWPWD